MNDWRGPAPKVGKWVQGGVLSTRTARRRLLVAFAFSESDFSRIGEPC